jgi:GNAT superfamily N-acetyltransferase
VYGTSCLRHPGFEEVHIVEFDSQGEVTSLSKVELERLAEGQALAFADDPMYVHVNPSRERRVPAARRLWRAVIEFCLVYGEVYTTPELSGVACWLCPGETDVTLGRLLRTRLALPRALLSFGLGGFVRALGYMLHIDACHHRLMKGRPHWYLTLLGVHPADQGLGIGERLLQPVLHKADEGNIPCYLETTNPPNVGFYRKHGFEVVWEGTEPAGSVRTWAMVREGAPEGGVLSWGSA